MPIKPGKNDCQIRQVEIAAKSDRLIWQVGAYLYDSASFFQAGIELTMVSCATQ